MILKEHKKQIASIICILIILVTIGFFYMKYMLNKIESNTNNSIKTIVKNDANNLRVEITEQKAILQTITNQILIDNIVDKEKIFDRIYKITENPEDVIISLLGNNAKFINDRILLEFNKNIRMAIKSNALFLQIQRYIEDKQYPCNKFAIIMKICIYVVNELMTGKYFKK